MPGEAQRGGAGAALDLSLLCNVRRCEAREARVALLEVAAPDLNRQGVAVASEAAAATAMATRVAAGHLVDNVDEHFEDVEANAAIGALPRALEPAQPRTKYGLTALRARAYHSRPRDG